MYRELILKTTINLYAHYGIRGVSMEQVAGALQMSKKTLYAEFGSKEELLCTCMDYETERIMKILQNRERKNENPVETIVMTTHNLFQYKLYFCSSFRKDMPRFRKAYQKLEATYQKLREKYYLYLEKGKEEGYFLMENDYETVASILIEILINATSATKSVLIYTFLRGLCTDKGIDAIDKLIPVNNNKDIYNYN